MCRTNQPCWWMFVCAALLLTCGTSTLPAGESARARELRELLAKPVQFEGFDDPRITLSEALDQLAKRFDLSFDINEQAFKDPDPKKDVMRFLITEQNPVPRMRTRLGTVLKKTLSRVSPSATYIIRDDMIEITTQEAVRKEFFADRPCGPLPPLVSGTFDKVPLETALKSLCPPSNSVVLDSRAVKEAAMPVTAGLVNVPLDTAVRTLADMAGLKMVPLDNVLYVTSKDNARALMEEQDKLKRQQEQKEKMDKPHGKPDKPAAKPDPPKAGAPQRPANRG